MMDWINQLLTSAIAVTGIPAIVFALEVAACLLPASKFIRRPGPEPRIAVLIPAHDEALGIAVTLQSVLPQLDATDRCLVVADNCSDRTADIARREGADVVERFSPGLRGKGYALDFGLAELSGRPPDIVVMIDADCEIGCNDVKELAMRSFQLGRPVQSLYMMLAAPDASRSGKIAAFAWVVKNHVRPLGLQRLGLPCQLMGSGMAFPWTALRSIDLANSQIVEDMKMGIDLALNGQSAQFCSETLVTSRFPSNESGTRTQRTRWEHGVLSMMMAEAPNLLWKAFVRRDVSLLALVCDLIVPPLALLTLLIASGVVLSLIVAATGGGIRPLVMSSVAALAVLLAVGWSWWRFARVLLPFRTLALAPWYAICKIPVYLGFILNRQAEWIRSKRD